MYDDANVNIQFGHNLQQPVILKFIRGEKNKDESHYEDIRSMPLRIEGWDKKRKVRNCEERSDELKRRVYWILTCMVEEAN